MVNNPNNLKIGDNIFVEETWEDDHGNYHDEDAKIAHIGKDGELKLKWINATLEVAEFLSTCDGYLAKDFKAE